eukprot:scaffold1669_cov129-Cylindrotheca_fusiformis.AAC.21
MNSRRKPIPIPPFDTSDSSSMKEEIEYLILPIHSRNLLQVDCGLQLYFNQSKKTSISYSDFCRTLAPKLLLEGPSHSTRPNNTELPTAIQRLSLEDRLWHDLYCVFVPQLYQTNDSDDVLERQPTLKNRMALAKQILDLATKKGIDKKRSDQVLAMLDYRRVLEDENNKKQKVEKENLKAEPTKAVILPDMTLEERVRARAAQREQALQVAHRNKNKDTAVDLIKITDALFSHARLVLRRSKRKQLQRNTKTSSEKEEGSTTCVFTFQELLTSMPNTNRKYLCASLKNIAHQCPGWVRWKNPPNYKKEDISKKATVWLETGEYKKVRAKLYGEEPQPHTPKNRSTSQRVAAVTVSGNKRTDAPWRFSKLQQGLPKRRSSD